MKKSLLTALACCALQYSAAQGIYQFADPGFEQYTTSDQEPGNGWNSFNSATGSMAGLGKGSSPKPQHVTPGANGTEHAVQIYSRSILGKKANGNLTTGMINMGSMTPDNPANYNYTKRDDASHSLLFAGRPDAVTFYAKFTSGGSPNGRGQFILHDGDVDYRDPEVADQAGNRIGKAVALIPASNDWTQYTAEFTYDKAQTSTQYLLASFTTNPTPGGSEKDYLSIDEVYFVYYHALSSLTFDGQGVDLAAAATETGADMTSVSYDAEKLSYEIHGAGATASTEYDAETGKLVITVLGNDFSVNADSKTVYTVNFATGGTVGPEPGVEDYAINFDRNTAATHTSGRNLSSISLTEEGGEVQTLNIDCNKAYNDLTTDETVRFTCKAGSTVTATFGFGDGAWMHGYVYIDLDGDKQYSFREGSTDQSGTELVSFRFYSGNFNNDEEGVNSLGETITGSDRAKTDPPSFTAPTEPGLYHIRYKLDWNSVDAGGQIAADGTCTGHNGILANGGYIVDALLEVTTDDTGIEATETTGQNRPMYDLSGRRLTKAPAHGIYIIGNRKVMK